MFNSLYISFCFTVSVCKSDICQALLALLAHAVITPKWTLAYIKIEIRSTDDIVSLNLHMIGHSPACGTGGRHGDRRVDDAGHSTSEQDTYTNVTTLCRPLCIQMCASGAAQGFSASNRVSQHEQTPVADEAAKEVAYYCSCLQLVQSTMRGTNQLNARERSASAA